MKFEKENAIHAFKAFNKDLTCRGFQFEIGKIYHHDGKIELSNSGFHACEKLADCFNYYDYDSENTRVAKVKVWGTVLKESDNNKLCAEYIEIIEELNWTEVQNLCNTGNRNTGDRNTGDCNTGYCNTGNWNTGNWNTGNWNTGNRNTGYFNTEEQDKFFCFNKIAKKQNIVFPDFLYFELIEWVSVSMMTDKEKNEHPECDVIGGYLKQKDYKEAFRESFEKAKKQTNWKSELKKLKAIPNFDAKIFEEISGIRPDELN